MVLLQPSEDPTTAFPCASATAATACRVCPGATLSGTQLTVIDATAGELGTAGGSPPEPPPHAANVARIATASIERTSRRPVAIVGITCGPLHGVQLRLAQSRAGEPANMEKTPSRHAVMDQTDSFALAH
ncbi:hypothetical protein WDZ92_20520 [Nostoc sp. NIES-2111]